MRTYSDLIYYKEDIIKAYADKRKNLSKEEVEDLLRCITLFLEKEFKKPNFTVYEIPNIGFLHKKIDFSKLENMNKNTLKEDNELIESAYLDTTFKPIIVRKDMIENYYSGITKQELQKIQNDK